MKTKKTLERLESKKVNSLTSIFGGRAAEPTATYDVSEVVITVHKDGTKTVTGGDEVVFVGMDPN